MNTLLILLQEINWSELNYTYNEFGKTVYSFPVHLRVLLSIALIFVIIILILLGVVLSSRIYKTGIAIKREQLKTKSQKIFGQLLFDDRKERNEIPGFFKTIDLNNKFNRSVVLDEIIHLHKSFSGDTEDRLKDIFVSLNFQKDAVHKLKDRSWHIAAKGMREISLMKIKEAIPDLQLFIDSPNEILRMESRIAIMNLSDKDPLSFLSGKNVRMTGWDAAKIYVLLSKMPEKMIPDFGRWLDSANTDVVLFCIQMISSFRQQEYVNKLIELLHSPNEKIRLAAVKSIRELNASQAEKKLIEIYPGEGTEIKFEILKTLEVVGSGFSAPFLENIIQPPLKEYTLLIQAVRALLTLGEKGNSVVDRLFSNGGDELKLIINHARDKRL